MVYIFLGERSPNRPAENEKDREQNTEKFYAKSLTGVKIFRFFLKWRP